jgi:hypothetical protein
MVAAVATLGGVPRAFQLVPAIFTSAAAVHGERSCRAGSAGADARALQHTDSTFRGFPLLPELYPRRAVAVNENLCTAWVLF